MIVEYHRPNTLEDVVTLLSRKNVVTVPLGGGTWLSQKTQPDFAVVDLQDLELNKITDDGQTFTLGATVTLQQVLDEFPISIDSMSAVEKSILIETTCNQRHSATIAGKLLTSDGRSPLTSAFLALDANLIFFPHKNILPLIDYLPLGNHFGNQKLIVGISIPKNVELRVDVVSRTEKDRPIVCVAAAIWPSNRFRVVLGGYGAVPVMAFDGLDRKRAFAAIHAVLRNADDEWGSAAFRIDVAEKLLKRILSSV